MSKRDGERQSFLAGFFEAERPAEEIRRTEGPRSFEPVPAPERVTADVPAPTRLLEPLWNSHEIQGDILAGFRKDHLELTCLRFDDAHRGRRWLAAVRPFISTTADVHAFNEQFSSARRSRGGDDPVGLKSVWTNVSFTYAGLTTLQPSLAASLQPFEAFRLGAASRSELLGDSGQSDPIRWLVGGSSGPDVHAILLVAADDVDDLERELNRLRTLMAEHAVTVVFAQRGNTLPGPSRGHEHFGFKDGVSQPGIQGMSKTSESGIRDQDPLHPGADMIAAGEFVLGREPEPGTQNSGIPDWMREGSFQVFRRLAQDVRSWWAQVARLEGLAASDGTGSLDFLAAKMVGRWRSGAPLARYPERDAGAARDTLRDNDFDYTDDPLGHKTPRFCHIRKMLPRDGRFHDRGRRLLRRGIPFGPPFDPATSVDRDRSERGLLFIAYVASIERQFEFLQRFWANTPTFPGIIDQAQPLDDGFDPIIGSSSVPCRLRRSAQPDAQLDLQRFVHTSGALYGFVPSLSTLIMLAGETSVSNHTQSDASAVAAGPRSGSTGDDARLYSQRLTRPRESAFELRRDLALENFNATAPQLAHPNNGDEELYPNKIASFTKGLRHTSNGEVDVRSYRTLTTALEDGRPSAFERIDVAGSLRLVNPQGGAILEIQGPDPRSFTMPLPPAFASREVAAEMTELYWMALLRDIPFRNYTREALAYQAAEDLARYGADAKVPKTNDGRVTPDLLFRGLSAGDRVGPYLSQFYYLPCFFGHNEIEQRVRSPIPGLDFLLSFDSGPNSWLDSQRGILPQREVPRESISRYLRNGRDMGEWVHMDVLFQAYFQALLVLFHIQAPLAAENPYKTSRTQVGFGSLGPPHISALVGEVAVRALRIVWYQKWFVHRRLRPEAFGARADRAAFHDASYPIHSELLRSLHSSARLGRHFAGHGLLPMAFPEGCPGHPAYGAGHATVAGACVTLLKAWFDGSFVLPEPVEPDDDGLSLLRYQGAPLTVRGELDKLASNVALGRNIAGVHWRSDATESLKLGEEIAIRLLRELRATFNEGMSGFSFTRFDGTSCTI